mgnify:CR=1 FL=1
MKIKNILFVSLFAGAVLSSCDYTDLSPIDSRRIGRQPTI